MRYVIGIVLGLVSVLGGAREVSAQSYAQEVWAQLQEAYTVAAGSDYNLRNYILGSLNQSADSRWTFPLQAATEYVIIGACDTDCSDLDIEVLGPGGDVVARDDTADDVPVVTFRPTSAGTFSVRVNMYACSAQPCYFGFGIFEGR